MTFHFRDLPFRGVPAFLADNDGRGNLPRRRPRLIARWKRGADGRLECRWLRQQTNFPPD